MSDNVILKAFEQDFEAWNTDSNELAQEYIEALEGDPEVANGEAVGIIRDALGWPDGPADIDRFLDWQDAQMAEALVELRKMVA